MAGRINGMAVSTGLLAGRGSTEDVIGPQSAEELLSAAIERSDLSAKKLLREVDRSYSRHRELSQR